MSSIPGAEPVEPMSSDSGITDRPSFARDDLLTAARKLAPGIRAASDEIERGRSLTEPIVQALADAGLYRMFLPRSLGGGEVHPLTYFDVVEELTRADSAVGWSILISTSTMTSAARAFRDEVLVPAFSSPRRTIMGGSAPPRGRAVPAPGGYRLTGRWTQGSNVLIAGWFHVGGHLWEGERAAVGADGGPIYVQCLISTADVQVIDTWTTTGMRGTGSHDYAVTDLFVPAEHVHGAVVDCHRPEPLYQFVGWTHIAHAALGLAIARVAIDEFIGMAGAKKGTWMAGEGQLAGRTTIQAKVAQAEAAVGSGRAYVREATADMWETVCRGDRPAPDQRAIYRLAVAQAMANAVQAVDLMYAAGGASAIYARSPLDRCLRDVRTAAAHVWVAADTYELAGRLLLGLDPKSTTI